MSAQGLFKGLAVVIDDELAQAGSEIEEIIESIKGHGGHVVGLNALPAADIDFQNFSGAAFFIMDWQLHVIPIDAETGNPVKIPSQLAKQQLNEKVEFLVKLKNSRLAPVFIFTNDDPDVVKDALHKFAHLYQRDQPSHIFVYSKDDVLKKGVFVVLNEWIQSTPSVLVLKTWEQEYERAKNSMFSDFYSRSVYWPAILWGTFDADGIPASDELGRVITRNLFSRMTPFHLELDSFSDEMNRQQKSDPEAYRKTLLQVLEGERFVRKEGLHDDSIAPGDVFKDGKNYWINIRPDCDCVVRGDEGDLDLYLLKGARVSNGEIAKNLSVERGNFSEREDEVVVFAMYDGASVCFKLKEIHVLPWAGMKGNRIGRLLAPFLTRVQQRYAGYLQRPGLPKIPKAAMPVDLVRVAESAAREPSVKANSDEVPTPAAMPAGRSSILIDREVIGNIVAAEKRGDERAGMDVLPDQGVKGQGEIDSKRPKPE
ncbi:hypothetical protein [Massilia sp. CF038]|uniref:hypothetical protein n=1 Tax=Massilia sp. CF038 TaxID=1881045 RepID=UPI00091D3A12|nr:hypothetical protein [Massilia sp. CF038]SHH10344.1 hypothetical protein SAMN05428948_2785 [Massilia sp. CF038]